jgi:hypothetical protein
VSIERFDGQLVGLLIQVWKKVAVVLTIMNIDVRKLMTRYRE